MIDEILTIVSNALIAVTKVDAATTAALPSYTYYSDTQRIVANSVGILVVDGLSFGSLVGGPFPMRILVKDEGTAVEGIYNVVDGGSLSRAFVLERSPHWREGFEVPVGQQVDVGWLSSSNKGTAWYPSRYTKIGTLSPVFVCASRDGQFIASVTTAGNLSTPSTVAGAITGFTGFTPELSVTGDGTNYVKISLMTYGTYVSAGTFGYYDFGIYSDVGSTPINSIQCVSPSVGNENQGGGTIVAFVAPFTGARTYQIYMKPSSTTMTVTLQATAQTPTILWAEWSGPNAHA